MHVDFRCRLAEAVVLHLIGTDREGEDKEGWVHWRRIQLEEFNNQRRIGAFALAGQSRSRLEGGHNFGELKHLILGVPNKLQRG